MVDPGRTEVDARSILVDPNRSEVDLGLKVDLGRSWLIQGRSKVDLGRSEVDLGRSEVDLGRSWSILVDINCWGDLFMLLACLLACHLAALEEQKDSTLVCLILPK